MNNGNLVPLVPGDIGNNRQISPSKHWCFTYNGHIDLSVIEDFSTICSNSSKKWVFQEEIGETTGNHHLQGYICFNKKVRPLSTTFKKYTIHWSKCRNIQASIGYCSDPEKRKPMGEIRYEGIHLTSMVKVICEQDFYTWQKDVVDRIKEDDDRTIYWIWDREGNVGKSALVKYLCLKANAILLSGKGSDMKYGIVKYFEQKGHYPALILIDIPRTSLDYVSYSAIEEIKNGCFFSGKYEGSMCIFNCPQIVCFANDKPKTEKMSLDRWRIGYIKKDIVNKDNILYWKKAYKH